jgi:hypothetical protein
MNLIVVQINHRLLGRFSLVSGFFQRQLFIEESPDNQATVKKVSSAGHFLRTPVPRIRLLPSAFAGRRVTIRSVSDTPSPCEQAQRKD